MKRTVYIWLVALLLPVAMQAQTLSDVQVKRERTFTGEALYGFMNGGADLFLEYGVSQLVTRDVLYKGEEFTIDIYDMPSSSDAFGIYSLHTFKCQRADSLGCFDCLSTYQLQLAVDNKYVSIVFPSGSSRARVAADELVRLYIDIEKGNCVEIPEVMNIQPPYSGKLKYIRGAIGIPGDQAYLATLLNGVPFSGMWLVVDKASKESKVLITFTNKEELTMVKSKLTEGEVIQTGDQLIYIKCRKKEANENVGHFAF